ncbi:hypothetical protein [Microvirus mar49]|uniref:Uncharacterized protein n=1 Tax=Microvirus mar49 TaxID=2851184 RepID=A0A8F5XRD3_9VIRU|nr:hypothetical protein [Microvirus mar49]
MITKEQAKLIAEAIITILIVIGAITACTNSLFVVKGEQNQIKTEQKTNVETDSATVKVGAIK